MNKKLEFAKKISGIRGFENLTEMDVELVVIEIGKVLNTHKKNL